MNNGEIQNQLQEINRKLDLLAEQAYQNKRKLLEREDLSRDLQVIGEDIYRTIVKELDEVSHYFTSDDLLYLIKKLLRNTRQFVKIIDQVESIADFAQDGKIVAQKMFIETMYILDDLDKKGYFIFFKRFIKLLDKVVEVFNEEKIDIFRDNIEGALLLIKRFLEMEGISKVNGVLAKMQENPEVSDGDISLFRLYRRFNRPEVKKTVLWLFNLMSEIAPLLPTKANAEEKQQ